MERRIFLSLLAAFLPLAAPALVVTQKSTANGITVAVTAGNLGPDTTLWDFAVVVRASQNGNLPDDLLKNAVLFDPQGRAYTALAWEGGPPVGNYRAGVLKFIALHPRPRWVELSITRPGEKKPRSFSWFLGSGMVASR